MKNLETTCVHNETTHEGVNLPIFTSTANKYLDYDNPVYPRYFNSRNQYAIVEKLCRLEGGEDGLIFSSGMAAISSTLFSLLKPEDQIILPNEIYGGTHKFIAQECAKFNIKYDFVDMSNLKNIEDKIQPNTKIIYLETPANPLLMITDLKGASKMAKERGIISVIDNTFATPINQRPLELGIDVTLHSGTKYLGGHSDLCFGAMVSSKKIKDIVYKSAICFGGSLNGLDCYLIARSLQTLAIRVKQHNENAMKVAQFLKDNPNTDKIFYPGLHDHPNHKIAAEQMNNGFGGMLSFELLNSKSTENFLKKLKLIVPAVSLGGVESTICQPSTTSHVKMPKEERLKIGVTDSLLRLSVGIENADDIIGDLEQALL